VRDDRCTEQRYRQAQKLYASRPLGKPPGKAPADLQAKLPNPFGGKLASKFSGKLPGPLSGQFSWKLTRQLHWLEAKLAPTLSWLFYDESPPESAEASIHRHIIACSVLIGVLAFGLGGWALTAEISGR
jgi:hypothetical protein